jgi:hypothetical protein
VRFWWQWIVANSLAELLGLGIVVAIGFEVTSHLGEPQDAAQAIAIALLFVSLGAIEGFVVGWAQNRVLRPKLPALDGWTGATVTGAVAAWALGMIPSTVMSIAGPADGTPAPPMNPVSQYLLAAALGAVAGPILAFFQWRRLRPAIGPRSAAWLPANALAWAAGMPVIFAGADIGASLAAPAATIACIALTLALAGGIVGAIHGRILLRMLPPP